MFLRIVLGPKRKVSQIFFLRDVGAFQHSFIASYYLPFKDLNY